MMKVHGLIAQLANSFGEQQKSSLEDYIQLFIMMQYNDK